MSRFSDELSSLIQRSGIDTGRMRTEMERAAFATNVRKDISSIMYQVNVVYKELVKSLSAEEALDALDYGISGNVIYSHVRASSADGELYYSSTLGRALTIKESLDRLVSEITRLENELAQAVERDEYDDAILVSDIEENRLNLDQVVADTFGGDYALDNDGNSNLSYPLAEAIDAIGAFFTGYPVTGITHTGSFPTLSLTVLLSDVVVDTTLAQSAITNLPTHLSAIRTFTGMNTATSTTDYSSYGGSLDVVSNGDSLEQAIWKLDQANAKSLQDAYDVDEAIVINVGAVSIQDNATPTNVMFRWLDGSGNLIGSLVTNGIDLEANKWLALKVHSTDPAASSGQGRLNTRPDATSSKTELFYRNSSGSDSNAQITRDGIVKELEVGHTVIYSSEFKRLTASTGPDYDKWEYADFAVGVLKYDKSTSEKAYATVAIPEDENGNRPTRFRAIGHFVLGPVGSYPGGTGIRFDLFTSALSPSTPGTVPSLTTIIPGWSSPDSKSVVGLGAGSVDDLVSIEFDTETLSTNSLGLLTFKLSRDVSHIDDTWDDEVGLISLHIVWFR